MKRMFLWMAFFAISISSAAQTVIPKNPETNKFSYSGVINAEGVNAAELFIRGTKWLESKYKTQNFELRNEQEGKLAHKGNYPIVNHVSGIVIETTMLYTVTIFVKEGKFKYEFTDFVRAMGPEGTNTSTLETFEDQKIGKKLKEELYKQLDDAVKKDITNLKLFMEGKASGNDW